MANILWPQGNTRTLQPFTLQNGVGPNASAQDLTGWSVITVRVARSDKTPLIFTNLTGSATPTNLAAGQFNFKFSAADVATPGNYVLVVQVDYGAGDSWVGPPIPFVIQETR